MSEPATFQMLDSHMDVPSANYTKGDRVSIFPLSWKVLLDSFGLTAGKEVSCFLISDLGCG